MITQTATSPVADDASRVPAIGVAGTRAMFAASASHLPMLRGPRIAYAPEDDAGAAAPAAEAETDAGDPDRQEAPDDDVGAETADGDGDDDGTGKTGNPDDDTEEVEHDGQKFKVPKALKDAFLRQADYTKKTQEIAETKRSLEAERTTWQSQQAERVAEIEAFQEEVGKVHSLKAQVAGFADLDWDQAYKEAIASDDPKDLAGYNRARAQFEALRGQLSEAEGALKSKIEAHQQNQREASAKAMQDVGKVLAEKIPNFSREVSAQLVEAASTRGFTVEDLQTWTDPRAWLLLHDFHEAKAKIASLETQLKGKTKVAEQEKAQGARPAASVSARSTPSTGPDDRNNTDNWMEKRRAQLAAKAQAGGRK